MARAGRLLELIQVLRRHRRPVRGQALADELGISLRTLYRDIATLQSQGAMIEGEPGFGYVLRAGFMLPPLMFSDEEVEALVLGSRWVAERGDTRIAAAAQNALTKIDAVLPPDLRDALAGTALLVAPGGGVMADTIDLALVREAIRREHRLLIAYRDTAGTASDRTIWPFALGYFERVRLVVAWCELRQDFRHFRADRIARMTALGTRYPRRRHALLREWRVKQSMA